MLQISKIQKNLMKFFTLVQKLGLEQIKSNNTFYNKLKKFNNHSMNKE